MSISNARASPATESRGGSQCRYDASVRTTSLFASALPAALSAAAFFRAFLLVCRAASLIAVLAAAVNTRFRGAGTGFGGSGTGSRAGGGGASSTTPPSNHVSKSLNSADHSSPTWKSSLFPTVTQTHSAMGSGW